MAGKRLHLLAEDEDDLKVVSSALQDAVIKIGDIRYEARARRLTIACNRFRWEEPGERVRAAIQLGCVLGVEQRNLRPAAKDAVLELLAVAFEAGEAPGGTITFAFAGGGDLRCTVECIEAVLTDVSNPWPTPRSPNHTL